MNDKNPMEAKKQVNDKKIDMRISSWIVKSICAISIIGMVIFWGISMLSNGMKEGYAYVLSMEYWSRIGSSDITFKRPGRADEFFRDLENSAGYELRAYTDQALFCFGPGRSCLMTGIA